MICSKCGAVMPEDSAFCAQCGATIEGAAPNNTGNTAPEAEKAPYVYSQPSYEPRPEQPQNIPPQYYNNRAQQAPFGEKPINSTTYLVFSILVTVMCCLPFGIPAIVYAAKIDKLQAMGDIAGAKAAAKSSKMWSIIAGASIALFAVAYILILVFGIAAGGASYMGNILY